ncbi:MAG: condensation domain-containing protein [Myxococcota bacterium]
MRTALRWHGETAAQFVESSIDVKLTPIDLRQHPSHERETRMMALLLEETDKSFDLTQAPLFRLMWIRMADEENVIFFMPHHVIWDGWSFDTFLRELSQTYEAYSQGNSPALPDLPVSYGDFAAWHRQWLQGAELERQATFWLERLQGELKPLDLPSDRPRPAAMSFKGESEWVEVSKDKVEALTELGRGSRATLFMVLIAVFKTLLHRYTGHEDILIGTPVRGRSQPETEDMIGFFVNAVVLRTAVEADLTFRQLIGRVRDVCLDAFSHQDTPFELLLQKLGVERDLSRTPIYQSFFSFQDARNRGNRYGDLRAEQVHVLSPSAATDLSLWVMHTHNGLVGGLNYSTDLFDAERMQRLLQHFACLIDSVLQNPESTLGALNVLPAHEAAQLRRWQGVAATGGANVLLHHRIEAQVERTPSAIALTFEGEKITYAQLNERANRLAHWLHRQGVGRRVLWVCVCGAASTWWRGYWRFLKRVAHTCRWIRIIPRALDVHG